MHEITYLFWFKSKLIVFGTFEDVEPFEVSSDIIVVNVTRFGSGT